MAELQDDLDSYPIAESGDLIEQVPVIDVGEIVRDAATPAAVEAVEAIGDACREWGFFQVVNHDVPQELIDATCRETANFFYQPQDVKDAIMRSRENPWGYYNNELTKNQRDKKEVFDYTTEGADPIYACENRWPDIDDAFRSTLSSYRDAVTGLSHSLLEAFCVGLDLPADFMRKDFETGHTGFIRLNFYPVKDPMARSNVEHLPVADLGVHHHTDAGALTVLLQDDVGGLQVFKDGLWHNIPPVPGAFVINTGDMMQVWSNDIYQAAIHRVLAMDSKDRFSIPFFFNPAAETRVSPLPTVVTDDRPAHYQIINWSDFRGKRTDGDYADYGPEVQISQYRI
jgi:isopenicillin N synthase-like dioxygenase